MNQDISFSVASCTSMLHSDEIAFGVRGDDFLLNRYYAESQDSRESFTE